MTEGFSSPPGVCAITTYGNITAITHQCLSDMRSHADRMGLHNINWMTASGILVDKCRNDVCRAMLKTPSQWLLFIDADMQFKPELLEILLRTAYADPQTSHFDIVGGWCPLRGHPYLPTMDCGSGQWESRDANCGPAEVMRTGGACLLIKRHVLERMEFPWFGVRPAPRALDMIFEVDNYARIKFDGKNPFAGSQWDALLQCAQQDAANQRNDAIAKGNMQPGWEFAGVGEDSAFTDKAKALGFRIVVQTDAVCNHLEQRPITPELHVDAIKEVVRNQALACGVIP